MSQPQPPWTRDALAKAVSKRSKSRSSLAALLAPLYRLRRLRGVVRRLILRLEGGPMMSQTWRSILNEHFGAQVGAYSYGDILTPGVLPRGSKVGRFCSVGTGLIVRRRNHPIERPILHPFFYNAQLGLLTKDTIEADADNPLTIGHDVWIADRVTILGGCHEIGNGAVIAAGAVVTKDVPPYTIVAGTPAKPLRARFDAERQADIEQSQWWTREIDDLIRDEPFTDIFGPTRG